MGLAEGDKGVGLAPVVLALDHDGLDFADGLAKCPQILFYFPVGELGRVRGTAASRLVTKILQGSTPSFSPSADIIKMHLINSSD